MGKFLMGGQTCSPNSEGTCDEDPTCEDDHAKDDHDVASRALRNHDVSRATQN